MNTKKRTPKRDFTSAFYVFGLTSSLLESRNFFINHYYYEHEDAEGDSLKSGLLIFPPDSAIHIPEANAAKQRKAARIATQRPQENLHKVSPSAKVEKSALK